ncbi:MAG: hypothetical protein HY016_00345 [Nitrosomonadales bacterium]|nr:hypothetical protein [Nitrosomonadales bacterium]
MPLLVMMHLSWAETTGSGTAKPAVLGEIKFDHSKTGFNLTGAHILARCASCHVDGVFKGTPRDCSSCHVAGNRMGAQSKTSKHVVTVAPCERCHQSTAWTPVVFNHVGLAPGFCLICHNGTAATGKPSGHVVTTDSCDACHKTVAWKPLAAGGMPANHLPTTQTCSLCHSTGFGANSGVMSHAGIINGCATCHNGATYAVGMKPVSMPTNHLPTSMPCETCHSSTNFTTFLLPTSAAMMNHAGIVSNCAQCHNGQVFAGVTPLSKPSTHLLTSSPCENCHTSTSTFLVMNLTTPPMGHLPTTSPCSTCHGVGAAFLPGVMTHTGIMGGCASCHNGQVFTGVTPVAKPVNHLPTSAPCETCHSTSSTAVGGFAGTTMKHTGIVSGCTNCHNGQSFFGVTPPLPVSKATNHIPTSMSCETCHTSTLSFAGTGMNHAGIVDNCMRCHYDGPPASFQGVMPLSTSSFASHPLKATWSPYTDCSGCHKSTATFSGAAAMPANHLPTTQPCSLCHASFGVNSGVMNHAGIGSGCTTCHNGQVFYGVTPVAKPVNHLPTSAACETCHSTTKFTQPGGFGGTVMSHTGIASGCTNCHNGQAFYGVTPVAKPATHVPTTMSCETCHSTTVFTIPGGFGGTQMKHTGIVNNCATCHNTGMSWYGVTMATKLTTHIPTSQACELCHSTSNFTTFSGTAMNHAGIAGNCIQCHANGTPLSFQGLTPPQPLSTSSYPGHPLASTWPTTDCSGCHKSTTSFYSAGVMPPNHIPTTQVCTLCHASFGLGSGLMKHTGIVSGCTTCHNGQVFFGVTPVSKPVSHLPTSMACETCHSPTSITIPGGFAGGVMNHTGIVSGCTNCHNGQAFAGVTPVTKPATHVPTALACETCHSTTNFVSFLVTTQPVMNHTGITNNCAQCHNTGMSWYGVLLKTKTATHLPTSLSCETCHSPTNFTTFSGTAMNHTTIVNNCAQCHSGTTYDVGMTPVFKSAKHIPYATTLTGGASMTCEFCHSPTVFTSFMTGTVSSVTMHNGTTGGGACYTCHKSPNAWSATNMQTKTHNSTSLTKDCSSSGCHRPLGNTGTAYVNWN